MFHHLRHLPNLLTLVRVGLLWPFIQCMAAELHREALHVLLLAALTDALDGFLARRFEWQTRLGSILDPLADKVMLSVTCVVLAWYSLLPLWLVIVMLFKDAVVVTGSVYYWKLAGEFEGKPTRLGKLATFVAMAVSLLALVAAEFHVLDTRLLDGLYVFLTLLFLLSTSQYIRLGVVALRQLKHD